MAFFYLFAGYLVGGMGASIGHDKDLSEISTPKKLLSCFLMLLGMSLIWFSVYDAANPFHSNPKPCAAKELNFLPQVKAIAKGEA